MTERSELPLVRRVAEALIVAILMTLAYMTAGHWTAPHAAPLEHVLDDRIPFVPESVWVYLPGYWACFLVPVLVIRGARPFRAALRSIALLTLLATPFFLLFPVAAPRPVAPEDGTLTAALVRWLYANDPAGNTFPSLHVANATFCAMVTTAVNRRWGAVVWGLAAGVCVSVLTLKQHWMVDVAAAWVLATVGIAAWRAQLVNASVFGRLPTWLGVRIPAWAHDAPILQRVRAVRRRSRS